jgi:hypothetical protein
VQNDAASPAQIESQATAQQNESIAQMNAEQSGSSQPIPPLGKQQLLPPPPQRSPHIAKASLAQMPSHATAQQNESAAQTVLQHDSSVQPGVPFGTQQSLALGQAGLPPPPPHRSPHIDAASLAQIESHATLQQNESAAHTMPWQVGSSQPTPPFGTQQLLPPPPPQRLPHSEAASLAQIESQATLQQNESAAHTVA